MKRLLIVILFLMGASLPSYAQGIQGCYTTNGNNCIKVGTPETGNGAWGPLPVIGTVTISGSNITQDINLKQINGVTVKTGSGTAADVLRVELPTDGTGKVGLNAGSSIVGKVGVDQTTPGTTNKVVTDTGSTVSINLTVTTGSAYAAGNALDGLVTLTGVATSLGGYLQAISIPSLSGQTSEIDVWLFNSDPTSDAGFSCARKTAFSLGSDGAAFARLVPGTPIAVTASIAGGTPTVRVAQNLAAPFAVATLYACFVTQGTPTFSDAHDTQPQLGFVNRQ